MLQSLGSAHINVNIYVEDIAEGGRIVLTSDGVYESLTETEMEKSGGPTHQPPRGISRIGQHAGQELIVPYLQ
jgi:hypothetical protein